MNKVKWGIIGCGDVTEIKSGPALYKIQDSELVAVMRRNSQKAEDYAKRHKVAKWYNDAEQLINDPEVTIVYIATPPDTHEYYTLKALEAGKDVYVEKPMAINFKQCQNMISCAEKNNKHLFVAFYRRMLPEFLKLKELIDNKCIGEVRFINIRLFLPLKQDDFNKENPHWHVIPEIAGGGHFYDLAPHQLDILEYVFGPIKKIKSIVKNQADLYKAEDILSLSFEFESGIIGNGMWCFTVNEVNKTDTIEVFGSNGSITLSCFEHVPVILKTPDGVKEFKFERPQHIQQPFIETIVNELLGKGNSASDAKSAARTTKILEEAVKDFYKMV